MAKPNITPPFRTSLLTQNGAPLSTGNGDIQTTRDWWMYWNQIGDQINANSQLVTDGTHADRPMPDGMPDGAIYIESDRGVIYQNQGGNWQYIAGTMYGTLSPDQRPADLGVNDGGFEYSATDSDPANTGRHFIWSQTAWVETTPVLYGTHAARPLIAAAPARCLYVETDRGTIYQNQIGVWAYLAGTMWGTLVPDQRPTDLGVHDAGFDFRTTVPPPREFIWNQTAWIETTPATQTPWTGNINGAGFNLQNAGAVGVGNDLSVLPNTAASFHVVAGGPTSTQGRVTCASNAGVGANIGILQFANYGTAVAEKRIAQIAGFTDGTVDSGAMIFYTALSGSILERMRITAAGGIAIPNLSTATPGVGTRQLWVDPADGYRVKWAP